MSDTDTTDDTLREPFEPASADPVPDSTIQAAWNKTHQADLPTELGNTLLHTYTTTEYRPVGITRDEQKLVDTIMHRARTLSIIQRQDFPRNMHIAIFIDDADPQDVSMSATLSPARVGINEEQSKDLTSLWATIYYQTSNFKVVLRMLSDILEYWLRHATLPTIPTGPVQDLGKALHDQLPEPSKTTGRSGEIRARLPVSDNRVTAARDGLFAEIAKEVEIWNATRDTPQTSVGNYYIVIFRGQTSNGQGQMKAALMELSQRSNEELSTIMRGQMGLPTLQPADVNALEMVNETFWYTTNQRVHVLYALLKKLETDWNELKQQETARQEVIAPPALPALRNYRDEDLASGDVPLWEAIGKY